MEDARSVRQEQGAIAEPSSSSPREPPWLPDVRLGGMQLVSVENQDGSPVTPEQVAKIVERYRRLLYPQAPKSDSPPSQQSIARTERAARQLRAMAARQEGQARSKTKWHAERAELLASRRAQDVVCAITASMAKGESAALEEVCFFRGQDTSDFVHVHALAALVESGKGQQIARAERELLDIADDESSLVHVRRVALLALNPLLHRWKRVPREVAELAAPLTETEAAGSREHGRIVESVAQGVEHNYYLHRFRQMSDGNPSRSLAAAERAVTDQTARATERAAALTLIAEDHPHRFLAALSSMSPELARMAGDRGFGADTETLNRIRWIDGKPSPVIPGVYDAGTQTLVVSAVQTWRRWRAAQ